MKTTKFFRSRTHGLRWTNRRRKVLWTFICKHYWWLSEDRPRSFEDLKTVDSHTYETFHEACLRRGLLEDDGEWEMCLQGVWTQDLLRTKLVPLPTTLNVHTFSRNIIIYNYLHITSHNTTHWHVTSPTRRLLATTTTTTMRPQPRMDATGMAGGSRLTCLKPHWYVIFSCFFFITILI